MVLEKIKKWVMCLLPDELDKLMQNEKGTLKDGVVNVTLSSIVPALTFLVFFAAYSIFKIAIGSLSALTAVTGGISLLMAVGYAIVIVVLSPIFFLIASGVNWIMARILGGTGKYSDQAFYDSNVDAGRNMLAPIITIAASIPCVGSIVSLVLGVYILFLKYKIIKKVHSLSTLRAIAVIVIPIVVLIAVVVILVIVVYGFLFATLFSRFTAMS